MLIFLILSICLMVNGAEKVLKLKISDCYKKLSKGYFFCNWSNLSLKKKVAKKPYQTYGYCCPEIYEYSERHKNCTPNKKTRGGYRCTKPVNPTLPMYMTYWPEQKKSNCDITKRSITTFPNQVTFSRSTIKPRFAKYYESCYWTVTAPTLLYRSNAELTINI